MDVFHRNVVASLADECGLISHEFGEEEIDRYVVVYKPAHAPSPDEVARLTLKHTMKIADDTVEKIISAPNEPPVPAQPPQRKKSVKNEDEDEDPLPSEQLRAVGTVKRIRRNASDVMEEIRLKKRMEKIASSTSADVTAIDQEIDNLFAVPSAYAEAAGKSARANVKEEEAQEEWDEVEEF